jgi:hypothetical protein
VYITVINTSIIKKITALMSVSKIISSWDMLGALGAAASCANASMPVPSQSRSMKPPTLVILCNMDLKFGFISLDFRFI